MLFSCCHISRLMAVIGSLGVRAGTRGSDYLMGNWCICSWQGLWDLEMIYLINVIKCTCNTLYGFLASSH
ncbi:hypothetical protein XENTR_v10007077 [Xenopus tropicalis]|nr:hypothetical protein XENTR_v10007077 [Xenopus tropicalis]